MTNLTKEEFYTRVSELFDTEYIAPTGCRRTRWGPRTPGCGRIEGYGMARWYGPNNIYVCLRKPISVSRTFNSADTALEYLEEVAKGT